MKIDCYISEGCSSEAQLRENLDAALTDIPVKPDIRFNRISEEEALEKGVAGSPTVMINGFDILPGENLLAPSNREAGFCGLHERENEAAFMWRTTEHKLILRFHRKTDASEYTEQDIIGGEFYKLKADPQEWNDLYGSEDFEALQSGMTGSLMEHLGKLGRI